ncbi:MAG: Gfo/Idh/MocA family oxidoreductase [Bryobacteraceae bacterium]|nr:Gfo/Idh/MocA family oxidoreductase [Bryobacteraceae bacterium]
MKSSRREFLRTAAVAGFPTIVPAHVLGQSAPSNLIQVAQLGWGRIARASEFPGILRHADVARFVAVCDVDTVRLADAKELIEAAYARRFGSGNYAAVKTHTDYREMLADKSIDAIAISTPDHWHAEPAMHAALAGKHIYLQKPAALTIQEGRQMADVVTRTGVVFQLGSQQRSDHAFRHACEMVRNGRIGKIKEIYIGLPYDPSGPEEPEMPVPKNLDYDKWLGSTPAVYYTENRVHPQSPDMRKRYDRPGWLRCEQFGAGMITGWGTHHYDIAHWAMGVEKTGPVEVVALAEFPKKGLWDVHGSFHVRAKYANGATMFASDKYENGVKFVGEDGWIWVTRGRYNMADAAAGKRSRTLDAHDLRLIAAEFKPGEVRLHASPRNDHHLDWLMAIKEKRSPVTSAEDGHRSCSACLVSHIAMRLGRELKWDPAKEQFVNDEEANKMLARPQRAPYGSDRVKV